ncbi:MAG: substrate-binding domain-containing protein [Deltaproteobacteria bacterium]|nr:substrate-binding domain-containing protein [Deltaproteobacteria bacterium]
MTRNHRIVLIILTMFLLTSFSATLSAESLPQSGKGMKIWFDAGGPVGESYATIVANGAKQAAADTGCGLEVYYSDWQPQKMIENFQKAVASKPDGIVIMGHPGDKAYQPFVDEAVSKGIIVTACDTELPELQSKNKSTGFGYAGADNYIRGISLATEAVRKFKLKSGEKAWVWGLKAQPTRGRSTVGIIDGLEKAGLKVDYVEISPEVDKDTALGVPIFTGYMAKNPDCRLVVMDHGGLTAQLENFFTAAGIKPGAVHGAGFSLSPATASALKKGYVELIGDDQPFMQGYFAVLQVVMAKKYGFSGFTINTSGGFVMKENIDLIAPLAEKGIR